MKSRLFAAIALALAVATPNTAAGPARGDAGAGKLDRALRDGLKTDAGASHRIIVRVRPGAEAAVRRLIETQGGQVTDQYPALAAIAGDASNSQITEMAGNADVLSISSDPVVTAFRTPGFNPQQWRSRLRPQPVPPGTASPLRATLGLPATVDPSAPGGALTGAGIGVALIDSGLAPSPDFWGRITAFYDLTGGRMVATAPYDDFGHGTQVAGLIGSSGVLSALEYEGVAPNVHFAVFKVLDKHGQGLTSTVISALQYVTAHKNELGVQIVNLSLGHPILEPAASDPLVQAVQQAVQAGLIVVTAAGNFGTNPTTNQTGYAGITSPGNAPGAITVGAVMTQNTVTRDDDRVAPYSSRGPSWYDGYAKPDVVAPGHELVSDGAWNSALFNQLSRDHVRAITGRLFLRLSGTSMSTAVTTGVVALMLEAHQRLAPSAGAPPLTPNLVKAILQYSAIPVHDDSGATYDALTEGTGQINAAGATVLASAIDTTRATG
ncbi:MAG TPA: S8 family serine peptidase, partial [Vicinamibacterales bacterium]|nr:S8 family serine peptidase [Vicinamibacterales bacterium]